MEDQTLENSEIYESEDSASEFCSSSCCSESDGEKLPWLDYVKSDGSLFYIEYNTDLEPFLEDSVNQSYPVELWSHMQQSKSKLNAAEKIKRWMKNRRKKVRKTFPLLKSNENDRNLNTFQSLSTFSHTQSKDVFIEVKCSSSSVNSKLSLSEKLLHLKIGPSEENYDGYDRLCVLSVLPSDDMPDVKIGDWLRSINDIDVNLNNLEDVLKMIPIPSKVKLNLISQVCRVNTESNIHSTKHNSLIKELLGDSNAMQHAKLQFQHVPHGLFYLTIENGLFENDDVIYRYPNSDTPLYQLKGMFLTLGHMISDVASPPLLSCSVVIEDEIVNVGFVKEENNIMVLALPASVASVTEVQHFATGFAKLLKYLFFTLQKAFIMGNEENFLDNFLTLYFKYYLSSLYYSQSNFSKPHLLDILPSTHWLPLPNDLKTEIDDIMSELESSDFGINSDGFYGNRRIYNILGSCLFYKGYLLSSHLPKADLLDIHLFLHYNHILELTRTQSMSQIIIWREVFPSRLVENVPNSDPEFQECHGRSFLLIVVMQHTIIAVLLDDGGCALEVERYPPPEPFYVEEVQNTLFILQDCGITAATEKVLNFCVFPILSDCSKNNSSLHSLSSVYPSNISIHSSGPNMSDHSTSHSSLVADKDESINIFRCSSFEKVNEAKRQQLLTSIGPADGESDTDSSYSNDSTDIDPFDKRFRSLSVSTGSTTKSHASSECSQVDRDLDSQYAHQSSSSLPNLHGIAYSDSIYFENSFRMVSNFENNLLYYLHMDPVEGIFIAPVTPEPTSPGSIQISILDNFHRCCLNLRTIFERSLRNGEMIKANIKTKYGVNTFLQSAYEQGVLFQHNQLDLTKQKSPCLESFWVSGRLFFTPEPREVYVCYRDSTPQDTVEMAFRLGFGLSF